MRSDLIYRLLYLCEKTVIQKGFTALQYAILGSHVHVAMMMIDFGADCEELRCKVLWRDRYDCIYVHSINIALLSFLFLYRTGKLRWIWLKRSICGL